MRLRCLSRRLPQQCTVHSSARVSLGQIKLDYSVLDNPEYLSQHCQSRNVACSEEELRDLKDLYVKSKEVARELEELKARQNALTKSLKSSSVSEEQRGSIREEASRLSTQVASLLKEDTTLSFALLRGIAILPNATHPNTPQGGYEACQTIRTSGPSPSTTKPQAHKDHLAIATQLGWVDFTAGAKVTGSRWYYLLKEAALLELALTNYAMALAISKGFTPVITPDVTKDVYAQRCGFAPRDESASQSYHIANNNPQAESTVDEESNLTLAGTAEIPLAGYFSETVLSEKDLPAKVVGFGRAFRAEAGARGKESRGLYRVHQFSKVELFVVCGKEESDGMLDELVDLQETILEGLDLPLRSVCPALAANVLLRALKYRTLEMSTQELGASAYRKYDIEAWMPGRGNWGEVASASDCTDYQSRRLDIRYKPAPIPQAPAPPVKRLDDLDIPIPPHIEATAVLHHDQPKKKEGKTIYAHTLNATAAAIPRLILALIENGASFDEQGQVFVKLPKVLKQYWAGPKDETGVLAPAGSKGYIIKWQ